MGMSYETLFTSSLVYKETVRVFVENVIRGPRTNKGHGKASSLSSLGDGAAPVASHGHPDALFRLLS